jgi:hypothetical protein
MPFITRSLAWQYDPYAPALPPPLCFTVPAGSPMYTSKTMHTGGGIAVTVRKPKLMMDPSDRSTWQRPYRLTGAEPFSARTTDLRPMKKGTSRQVFVP